ncbi:putative hybrid periplasmic ligand-binding sensor and transcriptional regulator, LytR/AlgR family [Flavobacterium branchiophilum]|uniref:Probable hybrid periplasmic ligand-binding sensor and transcriptional regulator, LytR/AlgR family n=1 Tax=Flavobacterium branchiophilum (strain FL-15) TaxID=1034807 RepID=G2Z6C1_FLABF|nr:LytTR family DNA-binding domain-containing protein [Flavobacterium branchiophilum]CCB70941.1 Probable hybrid periplasmic ligand-binding sensor and transcriptional regulator, LytR/AlgR family [Flavobacterium branchiophilum FL-15]
MFVKSPNFLNERFPLSNTYQNILKQGLFISLSVYLFLIIFQPFGTYELNIGWLKFLILFPYSLITFVFFCGLKLIYVRLKSNVWNIKHEIYNYLILHFLVAFIGYLYLMKFIQKSDFSFMNFLLIIFITFAIGIPICMLNFLGAFMLSVYENKKAGSKERNNLTKNSDVGLSLLEFENVAQNFVFAKSEGNYCYVYYFEKEVFQKKLIRISLAGLENVLISETIQKCHRSYIVNTSYIMSKKGNAQGYKIKVENYDDYIPVSRKYINQVI